MNFYNQGYPDCRINVPKSTMKNYPNPGFPKPVTPMGPHPAHHGMPTVPVQPAPTVPIPMPAPTVPSPVQSLNVFPVDEGFEKGTMFRGVYVPYLNMVPQPLMPENDKQRALLEVDKYYFALHEMRMYLDSHPDDAEALQLFNQYRSAYVKAKDAYEANFGALDIESDTLEKAPFHWAVTPFPWKGEM